VNEEEDLGVVGGIAFSFGEGFAPRALGLGDLGPRLTQRFETMKASFIKGPHITWIAVIELFENVTHRCIPRDPKRGMQQASCCVKSLHRAKAEASAIEVLFFWLGSSCEHSLSSAVLCMSRRCMTARPATEAACSENAPYRFIIRLE
jgi:hypothetical protein